MVVSHRRDEEQREGEGGRQTVWFEVEGKDKESDLELSLGKEGGERERTRLKEKQTKEMKENDSRRLGFFPRVSNVEKC